MKIKKNLKIRGIILVCAVLMAFPACVFGVCNEETFKDPDNNRVTAALNGFWNDDATVGRAAATTMYEFDFNYGDYYLAVRLERFENKLDNKPSEYEYEHQIKFNPIVSLDKKSTYCFKSRHSVDNSAGTAELKVKCLDDYYN